MRKLSKSVMVIASMCAFMACHGDQARNEMNDDMNSAEHSKAPGATSDDMSAGRGDTTLNNGATSAGEQGAMQNEKGMNNGQMNNGAAATSAQPMMSDANIFEKLSLSDTKEIEEGKAGVKMATSSDVKKYAQMLVTMHTKMKNDGAALAKKLAVTPMPAPNDDTKMMMEQSVAKLNGMTKGAAFDKDFMMMQIDGHKKTLAAVNMMETQTQTADVKALLQKVKPVVQSHIDQAQAIADKMK